MVRVEMLLFSAMRTTPSAVEILTKLAVPDLQLPVSSSRARLERLPKQRVSLEIGGDLHLQPHQVVGCVGVFLAASVAEHL